MSIPTKPAEPDPFEAYRKRSLGPLASTAELRLARHAWDAALALEGAQAKPAEAVAKVGKFAVYDEHTAFQVLPAMYDLPEGDYLLYASPQPAEVPALTDEQIIERFAPKSTTASLREAWLAGDLLYSADDVVHAVRAALAPQLALKEGGEE